LITLWGSATVRTLRPLWLLEELGLDYRHRPIGPRTGETRSPEYTALNPRQKIPYLVDGEFGLSESAAILRYLLDRYGRGGGLFVPETPEERARHDEWCFFIVGELDETSLYVMRRHRDLSAIYGEAPAAVDSAGEYFLKQLAAAAVVLGPGFEFVMGERFGVADVLLTSCLDWAQFYGIRIPDDLRRYRAGIAARPAYQRALEKNFAVSPKAAEA
jgi:glutathione S-transferase